MGINGVNSIVNELFLQVFIIPLLAIFAVILLFAFITYATVDLPSSDKDGWLPKAVRGLQFRKSRLAALLSNLGINPAAYARNTSAADLRQQLNNCSGCSRRQQCDQLLLSTSAQSLALYQSICANRDYIEVAATEI